jgi:hypothetical protein
VDNWGSIVTGVSGPGRLHLGPGAARCPPAHKQPLAVYLTVTSTPTSRHVYRFCNPPHDATQYDARSLSLSCVVIVMYTSAGDDTEPHTKPVMILSSDTIISIAHHLTPTALVCLACTCKKLYSSLRSDLETVGLQLETCSYLELTSDEHHITIRNLIALRKSRIRHFLSDSPCDTHSTLRTSWFPHVTPADDHTELGQALQSIKVIVDTADRVCLTNTLDYIARCLGMSCQPYDVNTYIEVSDEHLLCPLIDKDLSAFACFAGQLYIMKQPYISDAGLLRLKNVTSLDISGCTNVAGCALCILMTHYALCHVMLTGRGKPSVDLEYHMLMLRMQHLGLASVW